MPPTTPNHAFRPARSGPAQPTQQRWRGQNQPARQPRRDDEDRTEREPRREDEIRSRGYRRDERPYDAGRRDERRPDRRGPRPEGAPAAPRRYAPGPAPARVQPAADRGERFPRDERPSREPADAQPVLVTTDPAASFAELPLRPAVRAAVAAMGITIPTPIQAQAIPAMLGGRDVVGQARTGSGKTLAFGLPIVERCDPAVRGVQALVLVPTRELAIQVGDVIGKLADARGLRLILLYGGRSDRPEAKALAGGAQIVVGTPGRTLDHLRQGNLSLQRLRVFVLDEGDEMLDRGFAPDVERILGFTPTTRQTALFSATVPAWVLETAARHLTTPVTVRVDPNVDAPPEIEHLVYDVDAGSRMDALRTLLDRRGDGSVIVFGRTKHGVKKLGQKLVAMGYPVSVLQGNLSQNARERAMTAFRSGETPILLATNVAARGLDVDDVAQVINYELPESPQLFTHRVGRTGRMGRQGEAITFIAPEDAVKWRQIERALGRSLPRRRWPSNGDLDGAPGSVVVSTPPAPVRPRQANAPARSSGQPNRQPDGQSRGQAGSQPPRSGAPSTSGVSRRWTPRHRRPRP